MTIDAGVLHRLTKGSPEDAWRVIINKTLEISSRPLTQSNAASEVLKRDRNIGALDYFLSSSGWDLWQAFGETVPRLLFLKPVSVLYFRYDYRTLSPYC